MKAEQVYEMIRREKIIAIIRGVEKDRILAPPSFCTRPEAGLAKRDTGDSAPIEWGLRVAEALLAGG